MDNIKALESLFASSHPTGRKPFVIAIVGGSGSGKSYLADRMGKLLGAARLNLDDFYRDRSHLSQARRALINFDNPNAVDWSAFERALGPLTLGRPATVPRYDFATHCRTQGMRVSPRPVILADGLWLLRRRSIRRLVDLGIFMNCPSSIRLQRRLERDMRTRGRTAASVRRQFRTTVEPMHQKYVEPQKRWAALVVNPGEAERAARELCCWVEGATEVEPRRTCQGLKA